MNPLLFVSVLLIVSGAQTNAGGIEVNATLEPDSLRLGERIALTVSVTGLVEGAEVVFPQLPDTGAISALGPPEQWTDRDDGARWARYELAAWQLGDLDLPDADVTILSDVAELRIPLPGVTVHVTSVLPEDADLDTLAWQPPSDVLGPNWSMPEKLALLGLGLARLAATVVYVRRRSAVPPVPLLPAQPPRERALEMLELLERSGLLEAGELKAFYSLLSEIVRDFLAATDDEWGLDLTTVELIETVGQDGVDDFRVRSLDGILQGADLVKFAQRRPSRAQAARVLDAARYWLVDFERVIVQSGPAIEESVEETLAEFAEPSLSVMDELFAEQPVPLEESPDAEPESEEP